MAESTTGVMNKNIFDEIYRLVFINTILLTSFNSGRGISPLWRPFLFNESNISICWNTAFIPFI